MKKLKSWENWIKHVLLPFYDPSTGRIHKNFCQASAVHYSFLKYFRSDKYICSATMA